MSSSFAKNTLKKKVLKQIKAKLNTLLSQNSIMTNRLEIKKLINVLCTRTLTI